MIGSFCSFTCTRYGTQIACCTSSLAPLTQHPSHHAAADASSREVGLNLAVATMQRGERAWVYITDPAYGYGNHGSFSFPSVPPKSQLVYDVTLLEWEPADDVSSRALENFLGLGFRF